MKVKTLFKLLKFIVIVSIVFLILNTLSKKYNIKDDFEIHVVEQINSEFFQKVPIFSFEGNEYKVKNEYLNKANIYYEVFNYYFYDLYNIVSIELYNNNLFINLNDSHITNIELFKIMKLTYNELGINKLFINCINTQYVF